MAVMSGVVIKQALLDSKISIINCERAVWRLADDYPEA
jgi:hypothetical protein